MDQSTQGEESTMSSDERNLGMLCHLLGLVGFLGPLIIWLLKKDQYPFVDSQGKEALNFQITISICMIACWALFFLVIPLFLLPLLGVVNIIFIILAAVQASKGMAYRYPFAIRLVK